MSFFDVAKNESWSSNESRVLPGLEYFVEIITKSLKRDDDFAERGVVKIPRDI